MDLSQTNKKDAKWIIKEKAIQQKLIRFEKK